MDKRAFEHVYGAVVPGLEVRNEFDDTRMMEFRAGWDARDAEPYRERQGVRPGQRAQHHELAVWEADVSDKTTKRNHMVLELCEDLAAIEGKGAIMPVQLAVAAFDKGYDARDAEVAQLKARCEELEATVNTLANQLYDSIPQSMSEQSEEWAKMHALLAQAAEALIVLRKTYAQGSDESDDWDGVSVSRRHCNEMLEAADSALTALRAAGIRERVCGQDNTQARMDDGGSDGK